MLAEWDRRFSGCRPVGWELRSAFPDRWVRFHSLPGSVRYPENEGDVAEILKRHNVILGELTRSGEKVVLLTACYSKDPAPIRSGAELAKLDPNASPWRTIAWHGLDSDPEAEPYYWHVFASAWEWRRGVFDELIRLVAVDVVADVLIVSQDCRWLIHPYDGGMDAIVETVDARDRLATRHSPWRSPRPDGL